MRPRDLSPLQRLLNSDPQINRGRLFKGIAIALSIVGLFALAASVLSYWWFLHSNGISSRSDDWGSFGAYVNGIAGTAIALTTLIALALTFAVQAGEMEGSRHAVLRQVFDSMFFQLLHRFSKIVSSLEAGEYPGSGRSGYLLGLEPVSGSAVRPILRAFVLSLISTSTVHAAPGATATLILFNGRIWTENPRQPEAEAVAIDGEHLLAVGSSADIRALAGPGCKTVDLQGRRVVPGFNDSHVHFLGGGESLITVQLGDANSQAEFRRRIGDYAKKLPKGAWVRDGLWDHQRWSPAELPTRKLIDDVTPDNPVFVWRVDGHMALANSAALKLAGVDRNTSDVPGGEIVRDGEGNPTGIMKDAATALVEKVMPPLSEREMDEAMKAAMKEAARNGVTSVQNLVDSPVDANTAAKFREFQEFARDGLLTVRIYNAIPLRDWRELGAAGVQAGFGSPVLRIGNLKAFADGSLGSATAWMDAPFTNQPGKSGLASTDLMDSAGMYANIRGADKAGLQVTIHAIGDRANHVILDLFERAEHEDGPRDRRFRIEHAQHLRPADIHRFGALHVIASMQPYHAIDDGRWAEKVLGPERIKTSYAWHSLLEHGAVLAFGSDWPVAPLDPLTGIYAATTRRTLDGKNPQGWVPEQCVTIAQAVHAYTMGSAFAEHQETVKGSLEPGKLADLAVLSNDIFSIAPPDIEKAHVFMTVFDGKIIYQASP